MRRTTSSDQNTTVRRTEANRTSERGDLLASKADNSDTANFVKWPGCNLQAYQHLRMDRGSAVLPALILCLYLDMRVVQRMRGKRGSRQTRVRVEPWARRVYSCGFVCQGLREQFSAGV
jgi:hypothetical protein